MSKLAEIRTKRCLSQNDLVKLSGVSRSLVTKYESGEKNINKAAGETLFKIATALSCKMENLIERKEEISQEVLYRMYCEWRKVSEEMLADGIPGSVDCGDPAVREDFSNYIGKDEAVLPGKSCMDTLEGVWEWVDRFNFDTDVVLVFEGDDTGVSGHDDEYVAAFIKPVAIWSIEDCYNYIYRNDKED